MSEKMDLKYIKMNTADNLRVMFNPRTVAVIGATNDRTKVGYSIMRNLITSEFEGIVYPVNSKRHSVQGVRTYPSVRDIPDRVDLAVVCVPARAIPEVMVDCGEAGVKAMVIISAGFLEAGEEGKQLFALVKERARKYNIRFLGPNCLGFIRPTWNLNASFAGKMALPGKIAFISQSGALCTSILDWAEKGKVGFSYFVSIGSQGDIGFHDLIDYFGTDSHTSCILIYMESLTHAKRFMSAARAFARTKPIIVLKVGRSSAGAKAAMSHTGSLSGDDAIFSAAFERAGIIRVNTIGELFSLAQALAKQPRPRGDRLTVVTNAGGPGVIASDEVMRLGSKMAEISPATIERLNKVLPAAWSHGNPIDVLGDADPVKYRAAVEAALEDEGSDGVLTILTPQSMTDAEGVAREITRIRDHKGKTLLTSWMGAADVERGTELLEHEGIPVYDTPEVAVACFHYMHQYTRNLELLHETPATIPHQFSPDTAAARAIVQAAAAEGRGTLSEFESKKVLAAYGLPVTRFEVAKSAPEAAVIARRIGFPVVMKILSPDILHKTDVGGVKVGIATPEAAEAAYEAILAGALQHKPDANIVGVLVEQMVSKKFEIFMGSKKDPIFGPVIVFGLGGVSVEVFKDTNIGLPPLNMVLAQRLIEDTKIYRLLQGYRGMEGVELRVLQFMLYKFAYLVMDFPEIKEIDINPVGMDGAEAAALDAKIVLDRDLLGQQVEPYSHLVISPYPRQFERHDTLADGRAIFLRPIRPEDEPMEAEMFTKFSTQTQRFRFFQLINKITHELLIRYTQIDYDREMAIIAEVEEEGRKKMAGVVRLIADAYNDNAEFAIVVADPWQKQGLGNKFTDYILEIARARKIKKVYANFLKDNHVMRHLFVKRDFVIIPGEDSDRAELILDPS